MAPGAGSTAASKRALSSKEATLFKELLTLYETRQLKKGLKTADQILKKFPEHGETLCMKGLILTHMGRREEGLEFVKKGIRLDLTSHICWHVFGLIQKGEKNYEEALKSYTQALRFDKENMNILRDAASLQTQLRLFDALVETRHTLLTLRPQLRQNWIALAVAYQLNGNLDETKQVLEAYEKTLKNIPDYDVEHSEVLLYHVRILEEMNQVSEALSLLDVSAKSRAIVDRRSIMELRARLLSKLDQNDEAEHTWRALIEQNPDSYDYYRGFLANKGVILDSLTEQSRATALQILREFWEQNPRASAARRLALTVAIGDEFTELVKVYLSTGFSKGIPSLFADVKALYQDPQKQEIIERTVEEIRDGLSSTSNTPSGSAVEPPTTYLWTLYFLAQHHSFLSRHTLALSLLDTAIAHTPTLPELYTCKARTLKRTGDLLGAARCMDDARLLDGQDRFLNTKCAKYRLRAGFVEEASEILGLFTKKDAASPGADLEDMQSLLYLVEEGDAHNYKNNLGLALKKYTAIQKVFDEIEDDQYDFHSYSLRKFTVNIYLDLIHWEDRLRSHPAYVHAALSASQIYVRLHDDPSLAASSKAPATLTDAEKKAKKKAKKAAQKEEASKKSVPNYTSAHEDKGLDAALPKDEDLDGAKLLSAPEGLERANGFLAPLTALAKNHISVWLTAYDVAVRRKKYLQALKAINYARSLDPEDPEVHIRVVDFRKRVPPSMSPPPVGPVMASLAELLPEDISLETYNSQYLQKHSTSGKAILACAQVLRKLDAPREEVENTVFGAFNPDVSFDIKTAFAALGFLKDIQSPRTDEFRLACDSRFELSTIFKNPAELAATRQNGILGSITGDGVPQQDSEEIS